MKNGKGPSNNELTKEFYIVFFGELGSLLLKTFNYSFVKGELSSSQTSCNYFNSEKRQRYNVSQKLEANFNDQCRHKNCIKSFGFQSGKVLPFLIYCVQTAYVKGRYIGESIGLVDDLLKYAEEENSDGTWFVADIEKAFDSVDHNFIFATLNKCGALEVTLSSGLRRYSKIHKAV